MKTNNETANSVDQDLFGDPVVQNPTSAPKNRETRVVEVSPEDCVVWSHNPRNQAHVNEEATLPLAESILASGRQQVAAIGRMSPKGEAPYEVIVGSRRLWAIGWLVTHGHPEFRFRLEIQELNDEDCFQLCAVENMDRADISALEAALEFKRALSAYYDGKQTVMAKHLGKSESWVSRHLRLADLPIAVADAYGCWADLKPIHEPAIRAALKRDRKGLLKRAKELKNQRAQRMKAGERLLTGAQTLKALVGERKPKPMRADADRVMRQSEKATGSYGPTKSPHLVVSSVTEKSINLSVSRHSGLKGPELTKAIEHCLDEYL